MSGELNEAIERISDGLHMWNARKRAAIEAAERNDEEALLEADDNARRLWNRQHGFPEDGS